MPYNPSSAYPRHSTYTPPVYGRGFARGFNEVDWGQRFGHGMSMPGVDVHGAIARAARPGTSEYIGLGLEAMGRRGIISKALENQNQRNAEMRQRSKKAAAGPRPLSEAPHSLLSDRPSEGPEMTTAMQSRGGRRHVAGINERLAAISQREEASSGMDDVVDSVLTGNTGGPMKIPKWRAGWSRRRGGA